MKVYFQKLKPKVIKYKNYKKFDNNLFRNLRIKSSKISVKKNYHKKLKKIFFNNPDVKRVTDNKQFWKTVKPCLTDKTLKNERVAIIENGKIYIKRKRVFKET